MTTPRIRPRVLAAAGAALFGAALLAGCSSEGAETDCSLSECTVTFDRGVDANADVLGVGVELVEATDGNVTLSVAGQEATVPVEGSREVGGLTVDVRSITADEVVAVISR